MLTPKPGREAPEEILSHLRRAESRRTRFIVNGEAVTFSHLNNPHFPMFAYFIRANGEILTVNIANLSLENFRPDDGSPPPPGAAPGILRANALDLGIESEEIIRLYAVYERIPGRTGTALSFEEFRTALTFELSRTTINEFAANGPEEIRSNNFPELQSAWNISVRLWATLAGTDPRRTDQSFLLEEGFDIHNLIHRTEEVRNNIDYHDTYPETIAYLTSLISGQGIQVPFPRGARASFERISSSAISTVTLRAPTAPYADLFNLVDYINYLVRMTRYLRVFDEARSRGKVPRGITEDLFIRILSNIESMEAGTSQIGDEVATIRTAIQATMQETDRNIELFMSASLNILRTASNQSISDQDVLGTIRRFQNR